MTNTGVTYAGDVTYAGCHSFTFFFLLLYTTIISFGLSIFSLEIRFSQLKFEWTIVI